MSSLRIFYDNLTGEKIQTVARSETYDLPTIEQDITTFKALSERNRETFDVLELPYDVYAQDFREARLIGVDIEKKIPLFEYPNLENPDEPIRPEKPLSVEIADNVAYSVELDFRITMLGLGLF